MIGYVVTFCIENKKHEIIHELYFDFKSAQDKSIKLALASNIRFVYLDTYKLNLIDKISIKDTID